MTAVGARLVAAAADTIRTHADELTSLDRAIGDGDHGINLRRGFDAVADQSDELDAMPLGGALEKAGMTLVMKVGGASGPLYGSLLMSMGKTLGDSPVTVATLAEAFASGVEKVKARGRSDAGAKTMLDVLVPVRESLAANVDRPVPEILATVQEVADTSLEATRDMIATKGRASFLGPRSRGHLDPGARSSVLLIRAVCAVVGESE
ncbi:MAG: dihydroxyacetone kinase subunit L [Rhodospirillaceae bacterium]|nr:dihydroxyacetone kinase subunit L [Rhodospirillaceae bacterium]MCA8930817.1 dihydroxyacetone kinase subunit L [Rhodospirillaceae bacterium]